MLLLGLLAFVGCREERVSEDYEEQAQVMSKRFYPAHDETTLNMVSNGNGGMSLESDTDHIPDKWEIDFKCQHGAFTVKGDNAAKVYNKIEVGQNVFIAYREVLYVNKDKAGKESLEHKDFQFLDAGIRSFEKRRT